MEVFLFSFISISIIFIIIMSNRWGRQLQPKGSLRGSGQNNINININFNAMKDKPNVFGGKKIDNFIQVSNEPKQNMSRPNVSMQTLKQKKKKSTNKQQNALEPEIQRKRSKSKIVNQVFTPQKTPKQRLPGNSKSIGKKSTQKRNTKSFDNLKKFYGRISPRENDKQSEASKSNQKENSRSKSRSRSKSTKKLVKDLSKNKLMTGSVSNNTTKAKNSSHNSKKEGQEQRLHVGKQKKSTKKLEKQEKIQHIPQKKVSVDRPNRKKSSQEQNKKVGKTKTPLRRSKQKESKSLKRLPLYFEEQSEHFDQQNSYKKMQKEAHKLLYDEEQQNYELSRVKSKKQKNSERQRKIETPYTRYLLNLHTFEDISILTNSAIAIQKVWKGYKIRNQFINQLNLMSHKIQMTRNKILNLDPKFWDDQHNDSILKADDAESIRSSQHSNIEKNVESRSHSSLNTQKNKISEMAQQQHQEMLQRISKLEQFLKKQQAKSLQLQQENKQLKVNLQKVNLSSMQNSAFQSIQSSVKSEKSYGQTKNKLENDPFLIDQNQSKQEKQQSFELRLPKKIAHQGTKEVKKRQKVIIQQRVNSDSSFEESNKSETFKKYKKKTQMYQCSSPKYSNRSNISINSGLMELFQKKEHQLKQSFQKKVSIYDRMLNDSILSPRTYSVKKNELQEKFKQQADVIQKKREQVSRVAQYIKQLQHEPIKPMDKQKEAQQKKVEMVPCIIKEQNHIIQDYGNMNLNSHRSKSESEQPDMFQSSLESEKSNKQSIFKKIQQKNQIEKSPSEIEARNGQAIRIFNEISEYQKNEIPNVQQEVQSQIRQQISNNNSQISNQQVNKPPKGLETTLLFIKQYCVSFIEYIQSSHKHKNQFVTAICTPIVFDHFQFLKSYRTTMTNENDRTYNSQEKDYIYPYFKLISPKTQVISRQAFNQFNENYQKLQGQCFYMAQRQFFLNSLLDAFNQSLDYKRPCSHYGESPVWVAEAKTLKNIALKNHDIFEKQALLGSQKFNEMCGDAIRKVVEWSTSLCGFIPESPQMQNVVIEQQQINHIRQNRIALMLEKDLLESEQGILDFVGEQSEVKLQISELILEKLINELGQEVKKF